jgi:glucose-6-phosphate isomerase
VTGPPTRDAPVGAAPVTAGGLSVRTTGAALLAGAATVRDQEGAGGLAAALASRDATLWGPEATAEASARLGWLGAVTRSRPLVDEVVRLREQLRAEGVDRVLLCGTGSSCLAPEVVCATAGVPIDVLDTTDPAQVRTALRDLERTVVVVSSGSGGTLESDCHRRAASAAFEAAGIDPASRIVVVTDPGSPLEQTTREQGSRAVFLADPDVGERYTALTASGLVPSGLAGADIGALLDEAAALEPSLSSDEGPALALGAVLGGAAVDGRDKVVLVADGSLGGFGAWAEQLLAGSTGKRGFGLLPVVVEDLEAPGTEPAADSHLVLVGAEPPADLQVPHTAVSGPLGAQFLAWEYATAVAARVLQVNPFDSPDVQESDDNATVLLDGAWPPERDPLLVEDGVEVRATGDLLAEVGDLDGALRALLGAVPERGYLAVMAYLDRIAEAQGAQLRPLLAARLAHPVTFGWAPRLLSSTGQLHKGGPQRGAFLLVTAAVADDVEIPGRPYGSARLQSAQALGDLQALADRGRPVLSLHLADRSRGLATLLRAAGGRP